MNGMKRIFLIFITIAVIVASIYIILEPSMTSEPPVGEVTSKIPTPITTSGPLIDKEKLHSKVPLNIVELPDIGNELTIEVKYNNKTSIIDPTSDSGKILLFSAQQVLPGLSHLYISKRDADINILKKNSSYIEIKLKNSHDLIFGMYSVPSVKLVFFMDGEDAGLVASLPSEGAEFCNCEKAQQDSPQFLRLASALVDATAR